MIIRAYPLKQMVFIQHPERPVMVRVWEIVGLDDEYPFISVESCLN